LNAKEKVSKTSIRSPKENYKIAKSFCEILFEILFSNNFSLQFKFPGQGEKYFLSILVLLYYFLDSLKDEKINTG
jgi:hypothetical protein